VSRYKSMYNEGLSKVIDTENNNIFFLRPNVLRKNIDHLFGENKKKKIYRMKTDFRTYINDDTRFKYFEHIIFNNRIFITFLAFMINFVDKLSLKREKGVFRARWTRKFLKFFVFFFVKKTILRQYAMFFKLIFSFLNHDFDVKTYILDNNSVTAAFISRFLAIGLRHNYDYNDMVIPIRRNLRSQMFVKKWSIKARTIVSDKFSNQSFIFLNDFRRFNGLFSHKIQTILNFSDYSDNKILFNDEYVSSFFVLRLVKFTFLKNFNLKKLMSLRKRSGTFVNFKDVYKRRLLSINKLLKARKKFFLKLKKVLISKFLKVRVNYLTFIYMFKMFATRLFKRIFYKSLNIPIFLNLVFRLNKFKFRRLLKFKRKVYFRLKKRFNKMKDYLNVGNLNIKCNLFFLVILKLSRKILMLPMKFLLKRHFIHRKKLKLFRLERSNKLNIFKRLNRVIKKYCMKKMVVLKKVFKKNNRRFFRRIRLEYWSKLRKTFRLANFFFKQFLIKRHIYRFLKRIKLLSSYKNFVFKCLKSVIRVNSAIIIRYKRV
jgi:hypothetical protein